MTWFFWTLLIVLVIREIMRWLGPKPGQWKRVDEGQNYSRDRKFPLIETVWQMKDGNWFWTGYRPTHGTAKTKEGAEKAVEAALWGLEL